MLLVACLSLYVAALHLLCLWMLLVLLTTLQQLRRQSLFLVAPEDFLQGLTRLCERATGLESCCRVVKKSF